MEEQRQQAAQGIMQLSFWLTLLMTIGCCVMWQVHRDTLTDPDPEETEQDREQARKMAPLYLRYAFLTGAACLLALILWKTS